MMLWKCCTQYASKFGKLNSGHQTGKCPFSSQSQRKAMSKNVWTTAQLHSSHTTCKVMLKILEGRLQQYVNPELPDIQAGFTKGKGTRDQIANIYWIIYRKSKRIPEKHLPLLYWLPQSLDCVDHNKLWIILKEMGIPGHLTCFLRNLYAGQEATVRTGHETMDWFKIEKGVHQGCILSPCLFNLYAEHIMQNAELDEAQVGIRVPGEISITSDMQMIQPLWQTVKRN